MELNLANTHGINFENQNKTKQNFNSFFTRRFTVFMIYEMNHVWTAEMKWNEGVIAAVKCNLCNCLKKPEKNSGLQRGFEPVTSRYRCDALPTELWSHWRWEQVDCGFICSWKVYRRLGGILTGFRPIAIAWKFPELGYIITEPSWCPPVSY